MAKQPPVTSDTLAPQLFATRRTRHFLDTVNAAMRSDIMSSNTSMDHTSAVAAALADTSATAIVFPQGGTILTDRLHLNPASKLKEFIFDGCTVKQRANSAGGAGHFVRALGGSSPLSYGYYDRVRIVGGLFDQNDKYTTGHIVFLPYLRDAVLERVSVKHRTARYRAVTIDTATDVLTSAAHGFVNGDKVGMITTNTWPTGALASGVPYTVASATTDTFVLTDGSNTVNFTDTGVGTIYVFEFGSWGLVVGGRNVELLSPRVSNGTVVYQDGVHLVHGDGINVVNGFSESGDDSYAIGYEDDTGVPELDLKNVNITGCFAKSSSAFAAKVYVPATTQRTVSGVYINNLTGYAGLLRNGGIELRDYSNVDTRTNAARISNIKMSNLALTIGSAERVDPIGAAFVRSYSAKDVSISGSFKSAFDNTQEFVTQYSTNIQLDLDVDNKKAFTTGSFGTSTRSSARIRPRTNLALSPNMEGATSGILGTSVGALPTGWSDPGGTQFGVARLNTVPVGKLENKQPLHIRMYGTSTDAHAWQYFLGGNFTSIAAAVGETHRLKLRIALLAGSLNGITLQLRLQERKEDHTVLGASAITMANLNTAFAEFEIVRTFTDPLTTHLVCALSYDIAGGNAAIESTIGLLDLSIE